MESATSRTNHLMVPRNDLPYAQRSDLLCTQHLGQAIQNYCFNIKLCEAKSKYVIMGGKKKQTVDIFFMFPESMPLMINEWMSYECRKFNKHFQEMMHPDNLGEMC